jgi:hypothetical protein
MKTIFTELPDRMLYMQKPDGSADVWLRKNVEEIEYEGTVMYQADEVYLSTRLSAAEIEEQFDSYFEEEIPVTVEDLAEAIDILADIILEG